MAWVNVTDLVYPVGSYYISNTSTSPATQFGGSWTQLTDKFLYATTSTSTGGSNTHTLTINQMPKHGHYISLKGNGTTRSGGVEWGYASNNSAYFGSTDSDSYIGVTGGGIS